MLGFNGRKRISGVPTRVGTLLPGAIYSKAFEGKTAKDASLISSVTSKEDFAAVWDAAVKNPKSMREMDPSLSFAWQENGVTYRSDCLAFEKNMVRNLCRRAWPARTMANFFYRFFLVDHFRCYQQME